MSELKVKSLPSGDSVICGFSCTAGTDTAVLIVGRQHPGKPVRVINAFSGEEAVELYKKLTVQKVVNNEQ